VICGEVQAVEAQIELADDRMVEVLDGGCVEANVVRGPAGAERVALGSELADEVREVAVAGVAAGGPCRMATVSVAARSQSR